MYKEEILDDLKMQYKLGVVVTPDWSIECCLLSRFIGPFYDFMVRIILFQLGRFVIIEPAGFDCPWMFVTYSFFHDGFCFL
jgi:hypothetical protein